jgi:fumarate hydratase class II
VKKGNNTMEYRIEKDSLGNVQVPANVYWGAQTQRSKENFKIGGQRMPMEVIRAFAILKKAAAQANVDLGVLPKNKLTLIAQVCDEILKGQLDDQFPLGRLADGFRDTIQYEPE